MFIVAKAIDASESVVEKDCVDKPRQVKIVYGFNRKYIAVCKGFGAAFGGMDSSMMNTTTIDFLLFGFFWPRSLVTALN